MLAGASVPAGPMVATESWPPNVGAGHPAAAPARRRGGGDPDEPPLPFADDAFDLVPSRHATVVRSWDEIARVLARAALPRAADRARDLSGAGRLLPGPQPHKWAELQPETQTTQARAAGLQVVQMRMERLRAEFFDIGAVIYFLRKVIWTVPDLSVERYHERLHEIMGRSRRTGASSPIRRGCLSRPVGRRTDCSCPNPTWMKRSAVWAWREWA